MKDYRNYHQADSNLKIERNGLEILEHSLDGFEGYDVLINNEKSSKILLYQKYDAEGSHKKIIGKIEDIELGNLLYFKDFNWLVISFPEDNKIYRKAEIQLCNATFPIKYNKKKVLLRDENGKVITDDFGKPEYTEAYEIEKDEPCVVENKLINTLSDNDQIQLPNGQISIKLKYQQSDTIQLNYVFNMFNDNYKIIDIDYTKVINNVGIVIIRAKKVQEG